jgi:peptidoglycan/LPS O-acetylase OafA/YrhL
VQQIDVHFDRGLAINGPLWTLSVEIGFYIVLPFIARWWNRHPFYGLALAAIISTGWHLAFGRMGGILTRLGFDPDPQWFQLFVLAGDYQLPAFAFAFGVGMTAAWVFIRLRQPAYRERVERWARIGLPAALIGVVVAVWLANRYGVNPNTLGGAPAIGRVAPFTSLLFEASIGLLMLAACFAPAWQSWIFGNRGMVWLADHSYGVYLIHYPILAYVLLAFEPIRDGSLEAFALWCALTLPAATLYGWASARWFERPIRRWARRYGRRSAIAETGGASAGGGAPT